MFKLQYNVLVFFQIIVNITSSILLLISFKISKEADVYFLVMAVITTINFLMISPFDLFMQFYHKLNDLKKKQFVSNNIIISLGFGITLIFLLLLLKGEVLNLFASGFDEEKGNLFFRMFEVVSFAIAFFPLYYIFDRLLLANEHYTLNYLLGMITPLCILMMQVYIYKFEDNNILLLTYAYTFGYIVTVFVTFGFLFKNGYVYFRKINVNKIYRIYTYKSFKMRTSLNIHNVILQVIINNSLSRMDNGMIASYNYAYKAIEILNKLVMGPSYNIVLSQISKITKNKLYFKDEFLKIKKQFIKVTLFIFIPSVVCSYFIIDYVLIIFSSYQWITHQNIDDIKTIFLLLGIYYIIPIFIHPYYSLIMAQGKVLTFFKSNIIFILIFASLQFFVNKSIIILIVAMIVSEFIKYMYLKFKLEI